MTENAYTTEYWVREIWHDAGDVVAVFNDEDKAREWAKDNFDEVYRSAPSDCRSKRFQDRRMSPK